MLKHNITLRLTAGLRASYAVTHAAAAAAAKKTSAPPQLSLETRADGRLVLTPTMALIGQRYRFLHALSESDLSQIVCAVDTYRHCTPTAEGRNQPLVAIKILNAQHWTLGAQEFERMRQLWRALARSDVPGARIVRPLHHFEEEAHFCIVFDVLAPLAAIAAAPSLPLPPPPPAMHFKGSVGVGIGGVAAGIGGSGSSGGALRPARPRLCLSALRHFAASILGSLASLHQQSIIHAGMASAEPVATASRVTTPYSHALVSASRVLPPLRRCLRFHCSEPPSRLSPLASRLSPLASRLLPLASCLSPLALASGPVSQTSSRRT